MGEPGRGAHQLPESGGILDGGPKDRGPHGRTIAGRSDAAAIRANAQPETEGGSCRCQPGPGGQGKDPPAQLPGQFGCEALGFAPGSGQGTGGHAGMLAVVGDHSPAEEQAMSVRWAEESEGTPR